MAQDMGFIAVCFVMHFGVQRACLPAVKHKEKEKEKFE